MQRAAILTNFTKHVPLIKVLVYIHCHIKHTHSKPKSQFKYIHLFKSVDNVAAFLSLWATVYRFVDNRIEL